MKHLSDGYNNSLDNYGPVWGKQVRGKKYLEVYKKEIIEDADLSTEIDLKGDDLVGKVACDGDDTWEAQFNPIEINRMLQGGQLLALELPLIELLESVGFGHFFGEGDESDEERSNKLFRMLERVVENFYRTIYLTRSDELEDDKKSLYYQMTKSERGLRYMMRDMYRMQSEQKSNRDLDWIENTSIKGEGWDK